jgi:glycosyltransferase involved in cell wall biosynthesis
VPLFAEIAKHADFDFTVVLTAPKSKHRPHWKTRTENLPFKVLTMKGLNIALSYSSSLSISFGLLPSLIRGKPDVIICNGFSLSAIQVYFYARVFKKKYIIWSEGTAITERRMGFLRHWIRKLLARHASAFIDAGTLAREYIQSLLPAESQTPFFRSYNCVDASLFTTCSGNNSGSPQPIKQSQKLLFVGQLIERKGVRMLLNVYRDILQKTFDTVGLVLVGEGPLKQDVECFIRDNISARIELCGQVPYGDVNRYYIECSAFMLLSLWDCNPLVLFEALHSGIPIICSDRAGNACDFIVPGENGYIVDPTDKTGIVTCVQEVLGWDSEKRLNAARASQRLVAAANYSASAQAFFEVCHAVVKIDCEI